MSHETFTFGGINSKTKWTLGDKVRRARDFVKRKVTVSSDITNLKFDDRRNVKNTAHIRYGRNDYIPLMIGSDYLEPCKWRDQAPKLMSFKVTAPSGTKGAVFQVFVGKGSRDCGNGRFGALGPPPADKEGFDVWKDKFYRVQREYEFGWVPSNHQPVAKVEAGKSAEGSYYTSALYDPAVAEQNICLIFWCSHKQKGLWKKLGPGDRECVATIEHFQISDIAGSASAHPNGTVFLGLTAMDLFALFMTVFGFVFFCCQCCCCFSLLNHEINKGSSKHSAKKTRDAVHVKGSSSKRQRNRNLM